MGNIIKYNSWEDKDPFGALNINQEMRISVQANEEYNISNIAWVILKENVEISRINLIRESKKYFKGNMDHLMIQVYIFTILKSN